MNPDTTPKGVRQADRPTRKPPTAPAPLKGKFDKKNRTAKSK
jgi:hypothetical protein